MITEPSGEKELLSFEETVELHKEGISRYGDQVPSVPRQGCVEGSLGAARSAEVYSEDEGTRPGLLFAAGLLCYLSRNHCFLNGNKRVALMAATTVLGRLGLTIDASQSQMVAFVTEVQVRREMTPADVAEWLADRLIALPH